MASSPAARRGRSGRLLSHELDREQHQIELTLSENIVLRAVVEAQGSVFI